MLENAKTELICRELVKPSSTQVQLEELFGLAARLRLEQFHALFSLLSRRAAFHRLQRRNKCVGAEEGHGVSRQIKLVESHHGGQGFDEIAYARWTCANLTQV